MTYLRVEDTVQEINAQVDQQVHDQHEQDEPLDRRKIIDQETLDGIASDPRQGKHHLNENNPTNEKTNLQTNQSYTGMRAFFRANLYTMARGDRP